MAGGRGDGWKVIVKINLPPEKQYHSGHSLMVQGDTVEDVRDTLAPLAGGVEQAEFILTRFVEYAQARAASAALQTSEEGQRDVPPPSAAESSAQPSSDIKPASANLVKAVAKKLGVAEQELAGKSDVELKKLLKEVKK